MKRVFGLVLTFLFVFVGFSTTSFAQNAQNEELDSLVKKTIAFNGGEKFTNLNSTLARGKVDIFVPAFGQSIPATFYTVIKGNKYRIEIDNPMQPFKQASDGVNTTNSFSAGMSFPPINRIGFALLQDVGKEGFDISPLESEKKKTGFRVTSPEGYYSDFYVDKKTGEVKGYDSAYVSGGREVTTSVEVKEYADIDGVKLPKKYDQRFDLGASMTIYASYKASEVLINEEIDDSVFTIE